MPRAVKAFSGNINSSSLNPGGLALTVYTVPAGRVAKLILDSLSFTRGYINRFSDVQRPLYPAGPFLAASGQSAYPIDADIAIGATTTSPATPSLALRKVCYLVAGEAVDAIADTNFSNPVYPVLGSYRFIVIEEY